jgi:hypothetical protein
VPFRTLGQRRQLGTNDTLKMNPFLPGTGWVVSFPPSVIASNLTDFEVYHISLNGPVGSSLKVTVNTANEWDYVAQGWSNSWDPSQPLLLNQTDQVDFYWNTAFTGPPYDLVTNIQPVVTLFLRHEVTGLE